MSRPDLHLPEAEPTLEPGAGYAVAEWLDGQPVPDLNAIAEERWPEVPGLLTHRVRKRAASLARDLEANRRASLLVNHARARGSR